MTRTRTAPRWVRPHTRPGRLVLALVCACQFVVILDASIVNVAVPAIQRDLGFSDIGLAWVVNGYLLAFAGFMLVGGRAADLFGQRRMLVGGLAVFGGSSLLAGLAGAPWVLVAARVAQGLGAALLAPATLAVINTSFLEAHARARAFGAWSAAGGLGGMAGAVVGGALTTGLSWRWVFLINVPIAAALSAVAVISLVGARPGPRASLDLTGAVTGTAGLATLIYGIMRGADQGWTSGLVVAPVVAGLALLVVFTVVEARQGERAMLPPGLFRTPAVAVGSGQLVLFGGIAIGMWYFTSLYLQNVLGYSAWRSGLGQTPAAVTFLLVARWAAALPPRTGTRAPLLGGCGFLLAGFGWLARADADSGYLASVLGPTLLIAVGIGLTFPTLMAAATADVPDGDAGIIGGVAATANQVGGSIGLAVLTTTASATTASVTTASATTASASATIASVTATTPPGAGSPAAFAAGYDLVFVLAGGLGVAIAMLSVLPGARRRGASPPPAARSDTA